MSGFEALIRWRTAHDGFVPPHEILPLSEESGQQRALGEWVLRTVCLEAAAWPDSLSIAVNISPAHFAGEHFVKSVRGGLEHARLSPGQLEIEITESALIEDPDVALERLTALQALGVSVAIDNFGTGYSSLAHIARLPVSKLKIDRSFLFGEPSDRQSAAIVETIVKLGEGLGIEIAVDGMETPEQLAFFDAIKPCTVQGYLISRPLPAKDVPGFLSFDGDPDKN